MDKKINYTARSFQDIRSELVGFSKKYYPEISDTFNDASVGSWLLDLVSAVGDNLNYHIDRTYQENNVNSASLIGSVLNSARLNNVKVPGPKASMCEVDLSCTLPLDTTEISKPNWDYAPIIKMGSVVGNADYRFELIEDVDFKSQFNSDGISNRKFSPIRDNNGVITGYTVTKSTVVVGGSSKVYKRVLSEDDVVPFMEIVLPEKDIMCVESIIFKESPKFNVEPQSYEYFIDEEEFRISTEQISTYRFFEVDSLSDQWRFGTKGEFQNRVYTPYSINDYVDYTETVKSEPTTSQRTTRYFKGEWKPITQKFITEYTDSGYLKVIFGCGTTPLVISDNTSDVTEFAKHTMTKVINNDLLGVLPRAGWTMFVLYRTGGGTVTNLAQGSINAVITANASFIGDVNPKIKGSIMSSLSVTNVSPSVGGKDSPSVSEIKYLTKYNVNSQERCVTLKDYKARLLMIPPKFGCPFRCNVIEDNNKVIIPCLGLNSDGKLDSGLPEQLKNNMVEYLSHYKNLGDYIEFRSGRIYNLGFEVDIFVDKNYTTSVVVKSVIDLVSSYMSVGNHDMGEDIFIGDLEKEINSLDGVISLIDLKIYALYDGMYSDDICPLPKYVEYNSNCGVISDSFEVKDGGKSFRIDLNKIDSVLYSDYDSMFEIKDVENDIIVKTKVR